MTDNILCANSLFKHSSTGCWIDASVTTNTKYDYLVSFKYDTKYHSLNIWSILTLKTFFYILTPQKTESDSLCNLFV